MDILMFYVLISTGLRLILCESQDLVHHANTTLADDIAKKVRVLCTVLMPKASEGNRESQANREKAIEDTWGKRCTKLTYATDDPSKNGVMPGIEDDQAHFYHMFEEHENDFDWFLLSNPAGYIVVENLRYMLADYNPSHDIYFKRDSLHHEIKGLKYILSRKALLTFVRTDLGKLPGCPRNAHFHLSIVRCFETMNLTAGESRDSLNLNRLLPRNPYDGYYTKNHHEFWNCKQFIQKDPGDCSSEFAVSFDDVSVQIMYVIDYLIYQLRPFGINYCFDLPNMLKKEKHQELHSEVPKVHHIDANDGDDDDDNDDMFEMGIPIENESNVEKNTIELSPGDPNGDETNDDKDYEYQPVSTPSSKSKDTISSDKSEVIGYSLKKMEDGTYAHSRKFFFDIK